MTGVCGVLIAYTTFQPELENQKLEQLGETRKAAPTGNKVISEAIREDFAEAKQQVVQPGGFAWGIRKMLFERKDATSTSTQVNDADGLKQAPKQTGATTEKAKDGR